MICNNCGAEINANDVVCGQCGNQVGNGLNGGAGKSKLVVGLLGIFLGGWGVHNFYIGNTKKGIIQIAVTLCTCGIGALWGTIEGVMVLMDKITTDAYGVPFVD